MKKNTGRSYEELTQAIFTALLHQDLVTTVAVQRNVKLQGKTGQHEIDVYWRFDVAGIAYETLVQCKDWTNAIPQGAILTFKAVLDDLPRQPRGVFVSRAGYQKGAREIAEKNGIELYELRLAGGRAEGPKVRLLLRIFEPEITSLAPIIDPVWAEAERLRIGASASRPFNGRVAASSFDDESGTPRISVRELANLLVPSGFAESAPNVYTHHFEEPTYIITGIPESPRMRVTAVQATIAVHASEEEHTISVGDIAGFILENVTKRSTSTFDKNFNPL
jgi:hypothetical protein